MERFWSKVTRTDSCWLWSASKDTSGYGLFKVDGRLEKAHRFLWKFYYGPIPEGLVLCHRCDVPACVNPDHLFVGTRKDNNADRDSKGRHIKLMGIEHGMSKLTDQEVISIRAAKLVWGTVSRLSEKYGVSTTTISRILNRKIWKHI